MEVKEGELLYVTKDVLEDLYVVARVYNTSLENVITELFGENLHIEILA